MIGHLHVDLVLKQKWFVCLHLNDGALDMSPTFNPKLYYSTLYLELDNPMITMQLDNKVPKPI
jgi:hypothetical protein